MTSLADFHRSAPAYFESQLLTHRDPKMGQLCFLQRRSQQQCPPP